MIGDNIDILKKVEDAVHLNNVSTLREVLRQYRLEEEFVSDRLNALKKVIESLQALIIVVDEEKGDK